MRSTPLLSHRWLGSIREVKQAEWDSLALPLKTPLLEWQWLHALEESGSISSQYGWQPRHLTLWQGERLVAAAPLYVKHHSGGEFVFDYWLADFAEKNGIAYYPKLVGMSPATPATGYRFLIADKLDRQKTIASLLNTIDNYCLGNGIVSSNLHFLDNEWVAPLVAQGFTEWQHQSYLWSNDSFTNFNDYLALFNSSQRKNIRRECKSVTRDDLSIQALTGNEISPNLAPLMHRYYLNTNAQFGPWAARFVNGRFFEQLFQNYRDRLLLFAAISQERTEPVALSLLLMKGKHLLGRYWGCGQQIKNLHFNLCYYFPIQWAIANGIETFDPGAGSPHKIMRGFRAIPSSSLHKFYHPRLQRIFTQVMVEANAATMEQISDLNAKLPFSALHKNNLSIP